MKKYLLNGILLLVASAIFSFSYYEILGISVALPYPSFMEQHINENAVLLNGIYHWLFVIVTISLPYALISIATSYFLGKWLVWWLLPVAIVAGLFPYRALAYTFWYWLSLVVLAIVVSYITCFLAGYTRNKAFNSPSAGTAKSSAP